MTEPTSEDRIKRAFDSAFQRFCEAQSFEDQEDEASNMLHHLGRLIDERGGVNQYVGSPAPAEHAAALLLYRHKDTHDAVRLGTTDDVFTDHFTDLFGTLVWALPPVIQNDARFGPYDVAYLVGRPVVDTLRAAFDAVFATS